jgi:hypothetical protein
LFNHWKAFEMAFFYINYGFVYGLSYFVDHLPVLKLTELVPKLIDYALKRMVRTFGSMEQALTVFGLRPTKPQFSKEAVPKTEVLEQPQLFL